jgi:glycosyltransferase involved in cell wall biosynthesis
MPAVPGARWLSFVTVAVLRPVIAAVERPSLTVVIPARNERGNIEGALRRLPDFGAPTEVIFVEGNSSDGTWEEIQRVSALWDGRGGVRVRSFSRARGKADAVRLGFSQASGELLTILDADLTMPPERLTRFYEAYCQGAADFVNGTRLVYPMEGEAMRLLNHLGNVFFAKMLSFVLDVARRQPVRHKLVSRADYAWFVRRRQDGDLTRSATSSLFRPAFEPYNRCSRDYRARTYGTPTSAGFATAPSCSMTADCASSSAACARRSVRL